jgi:hypothetical protein
MFYDRALIEAQMPLRRLPIRSTFYVSAYDGKFVVETGPGEVRDLHGETVDANRFQASHYGPLQQRAVAHLFYSAMGKLLEFGPLQPTWRCRYTQLIFLWASTRAF